MDCAVKKEGSNGKRLSKDLKLCDLAPPLRRSLMTYLRIGRDTSTITGGRVTGGWPDQT